MAMSDSEKKELDFYKQFYELHSNPKRKIVDYDVVPSENITASDLSDGIVKLKVVPLYGEKRKPHEYEDESEEKTFRIVDGYLKNADGTEFVNIRGESVNENQKIEAYRNLTIAQAFSRPEDGLGTENIPRPREESFLETVNKRGPGAWNKTKGVLEGIWNKLKAVGRDIKDGMNDNAESFKKSRNLGAKLNSIFGNLLKPFKYVVRKIVNGICFVANKLKDTKVGQWASKNIINTEFGKGVKAAYKDIFDNAKNQTLTSNISTVLDNTLARPARYLSNSEPEKNSTEPNKTVGGLDKSTSEKTEEYVNRNDKSQSKENDQRSSIIKKGKQAREIVNSMQNNKAERNVENKQQSRNDSVK